MSFIQKIWIDTDARSRVKSYLENEEESELKFIQGDVVPVEIYLLKQTGNIGQPFSNIQISTETLRVALGRLDQKPTSGTFTLTFGADTTSALNYNATVSEVQTALDALASIVSAGGVTVSGSDAGPWTITFDSNGDRAAISGDVTEINPIADMAVIIKTEGDASTKEVQVIKIKERPIALQESFSAVSAPTLSITEVIAGATGINEVQKISIDKECRGGTFTLSFEDESITVAYGIEGADLQTALEGLSTIGTGNIQVNKINDLEYNITFIGTEEETNQALIVADDSGLLGFSGFTANLDINSYSVEQLLNGSADISDDLYFEIELTEGTKKTTLLRTLATIENDLIDEAVTNPPQNGTDWDALLDAKADETITITGTDGLEGGGNLSANRTLNIANEGVTNTKLAHMATQTLKGRNTAGAGDPEDLSPSTVRTMLNVEDGATADQTDSEIETAYNNQVSTVSQAEAEAGVATTVRRWTAERVKQAITALGGGGSGGFGKNYNDQSGNYTTVAGDYGESNDKTVKYTGTGGGHKITHINSTSLTAGDYTWILNAGDDQLEIDFTNSSDEQVGSGKVNWFLDPGDVLRFEFLGSNKWRVG